MRIPIANLRRFVTGIIIKRKLIKQKVQKMYRKISIISFLIYSQDVHPARYYGFIIIY